MSAPTLTPTPIPAAAASPPSRAGMAALLDAVDDALLLVDAVGNLGFCNRAAMRRLGAEPGQGLAQLAPVLGATAVAWLRARLEAGDAAPAPLALTLPDGAEARLSTWREARQLAVRLHLTGARTAAAAPVAPGPTQQLLELLWASPFPAMLQDARFRLVAVNEAYVAFTGRGRDALLGTDPVELLPAEDREPERDERAEAPALPVGQAAPRFREQRLIDGGGRERWCRVASYAVSGEDGAPLRLSVLQDSTAEHVARAQADRSLDELAQWFDLSPTGMLVFDETGLILRSNRAFEALIGQVPVALTDAAHELQALLGFEGGVPAAALRDSGALPERHALLPLPDGRRQRVSARVRGFATGSGQPRFMAVVEDRSAEEERDLAQLEIGALMDAAGVGVATFDSARGWLRPRAERRRSAPKPGLQSIAREIVEPASLPEYERLQQALKHGERIEVRYAVNHAELGRRWLLTRVEPGDGDGARRTVVTVDVTEQEHAREAVLQQAARTRAILDSVLVGIVTVGAKGIEWLNRSARRMFGGDLDHFRGEPIATVATPEAEHPLRATDFLHALADGEARTFECRLRARDGREFWVVGNAVRTPDEAGAPQVTFALLDIERRRQAEVSIAQAQASLQRIIETAPLAIALFDAPSQRLLQLNQMAAAFFGKPLARLAGRTLLQALGDDPVVRLGADLSAARSTSEVLRRELQRPGRGGPRWWDIRLVSLPGGATGGEQVLLVASDVTEQRAEAQARFDAAIAQREMLVKEVHHRIKNNLQGVAGLLQHNAARHPALAALLTESVAQVQAIAQVYGLQVGAGGPLRLASVLEAIAMSVQRTFGREVAVRIDGQEPRAWLLPEAESIPIALTINELLTNAVKHGAEGEVQCTLQADGDALQLGIVNPGALPSGFELAQIPGGVSGLGLVRALLPRRSASLALDARDGLVTTRVALRPPSVQREAG
jgi:PAS domain S-box-containing protein